jgi:hypothetical protein
MISLFRTKSFLFGAVLFVCCSLFSILILVLDIFPHPSSWLFNHIQGILIALAFGPFNLILSFVVWPLYQYLFAWIVINFIGWLASAFIIGKIFEVVVRKLGKKWGYMAGLIIGLLILIPTSFLIMALISFG